MPFPYAYYQTYFDGPLHGHSFKGKALFIEDGGSASNAGGILDVDKASHFYYDTSLGNITIDGFSNSTDGQLLFIYKDSLTNSLTLKHDGVGGQKIYMANQQDLVFPAGQQGGAIFICRNDGGVYKWFQLDSNGLLADGTAVNPSLTFSNDTDTGIYRPGSETLAVATSGVDRFIVGLNFIRSLSNHQFADGNVSTPAISFVNDPDTGFWKEGADVAFSANGVKTFSLWADGSAEISGGAFRSNNVFQFVNFAAVPQTTAMGQLLVTDDFVTDIAQVPAQGIYAKGSVKTSGLFEGTATSAQFADLAERYEADKKYGPGTLVKLGGSKEITATKASLDEDVFGVISTNPGLMMNVMAGEDSTHPFVALSGRVPCKVLGTVKKGDRIVSTAMEGVGAAIKSGKPSIYAVVGRALEDKLDNELGLVEIAVGKM